MWNEMEPHWQECFQQAWEAYCNDSLPIGAVITDKNNKILVTGRNRLYEKNAPKGQISWNKLAHAEMNTLLQLSEYDHPDVRTYQIYTTMEPCPLCFGAIVMANVRNVHYAARDRYAGATQLNHKMNYIASKKINVKGPYPEFEELQLTIKVEMVRRTMEKHFQGLTEIWAQDCPQAVKLGLKYFEEKTLINMKERNAGISEVIDMIAEDIKEYR